MFIVARANEMIGKPGNNRKASVAYEELFRCCKKMERFKKWKRKPWPEWYTDREVWAEWAKVTVPPLCHVDRVAHHVPCSVLRRLESLLWLPTHALNPCLERMNQNG